MEMKTKALSFGFLGIFVLVILSIIAVASPICSGVLCGSVTSSPSTASAGTDVSITFNVTYESPTENSATLSFTGSSNAGSWKTLPANTNINKGETLNLNAVFTIPSGATGTISPKITVAKLGTGPTSFDINVPSIIVIDTKTLSATAKDGKNTFLKQNDTLVLNLQNTGNIALNNVRLTQSGDFTVSLSKSTLVLSPGQTDSVDLKITDVSKARFGTSSVTITAADSNQNIQDTEVFTFKKSFCRAGEAGGNLTINSVNIESDGDDDENWKLLDIIDVEVEVENNGDDDVDNIEVHLALFDSSGRDQSGDLDFKNTDEEKIDLGDLNDGDEETVTFTFQVPADFESGNYKLAVKAFSDDLGESKECTDISDDFSDGIFESIDVDREDDKGKFIAFDNIVITPTGEATCGDTATVKMDVFNIGDDEQDQVRVNLYSADLRNLRLSEEIRTDLKEGDSEQVSFSFPIPQGLENKLYRFDLTADYDYDGGSYDESSDESTLFTIRVIGCSTTGGTPQGNRIAVIAASLDSDAVAGETLLVTAEITSALNEEADFIISANGYQSWSSLDSISERILRLEPGESAEITISLNVNQDASGENSFELEVRSGDQIEIREIVANIAESNISGGATFNIGDNGLIWVIGIINVVLIILIIVVAVRISRKQ